MAHFEIKTAEISDKLEEFSAGDSVSLTGYIYTARDSAHKRFVQMIEKGEKLPMEGDFIIYYAGPTPNKEGHVIGSCGPTTSGRMDFFSETMMKNGMKCMIGKGKRADFVVDAMKENKCVYLVAVGGAGAFVADCVKSLEVVCFEELGCESVKKLYVENFEVFVAIDVLGNSLYI
ncbi:MAG: FumA C-terminus/TtdB family hydratase beta subunit [Clostridia bacterium]